MSDMSYQLPQILFLNTVWLSHNFNQSQLATSYHAKSDHHYVLYNICVLVRVRETHYIHTWTHNFNQSAIDTSCHVITMTHHHSKWWHRPKRGFKYSFPSTCSTSFEVGTEWIGVTRMHLPSTMARKWMGSFPASNKNGYFHVFTYQTTPTAWDTRVKIHFSLSGATFTEIAPSVILQGLVQVSQGQGLFCKHNIHWVFNVLNSDSWQGWFSYFLGKTAPFINFWRLFDTSQGLIALCTRLFWGLMRSV